MISNKAFVAGWKRLLDARGATWNKAQAAIYHERLGRQFEDSDWLKSVDTALDRCNGADGKGFGWPPYIAELIEIGEMHQKRRLEEEKRVADRKEREERERMWAAQTPEERQASTELFGRIVKDLGNLSPDRGQPS